MHGRNRHALAAWAALALVFALAGCGPAQVRPFAYTDPKEMAGRPGLFTGVDGGINFRR